MQTSQTYTKDVHKYCSKHAKCLQESVKLCVCTVHTARLLAIMRKMQEKPSPSGVYNLNECVLGCLNNDAMHYAHSISSWYETVPTLWKAFTKDLQPLFLVKATGLNNKKCLWLASLSLIYTFFPWNICLSKGNDASASDLIYAFSFKLITTEWYVNTVDTLLI